MFLTRLITTLVLGTLVFFSLWLPPFYFAWLLLVPLGIAAYEFARLIALPKHQVVFYCLFCLVLYGANRYLGLADLGLGINYLFWLLPLSIYLLLFTLYSLFVRLPQVSAVIGLWGILSLLTTAETFVWLQADHLNLLGILIITVASADIGGYVFGKLWGKRKLAPHISPGKTWAGLYGGLFSAVVLNLIYLGILPGFQPEIYLLAVSASFILVPISLCGDLFESLLKRKQGLKDSGTIIPGHGGMMDRVDGLILAAPIYVLLLKIYLYFL